MGGDPKVQDPSSQMIKPPSVEENISAYINQYPRLFELQKQYAPQEAQQQLDLLNQFSLPMAQANLRTQQAINPEITALGENLGKQAREGMANPMPQSVLDQYRSDMGASMGTNAGSPISADYMSRGLMNQREDWKKYYQNLAMSLSGRQPLQQGAMPNYNNITGSFTPGQVMNYNSSTYGSQAGLYGSMYNTNAQMAQQNAMRPFQWMQGAGNLMQGVGSMTNPFGNLGKVSGGNSQMAMSSY